MLRSTLTKRLDDAAIDYLKRRSRRARGHLRDRIPDVDLLAAEYLHQEHLDDGERSILSAVDGITLVNPLGLHALVQAVDYVVEREIPGAFVECGTYRGGCAMAVAMRLVQLGATDREIHLFDTFEGMPPPARPDDQLTYLSDGQSIGELFEDARSDEAKSAAWFSDVETIARDNVLGTGFPAERLHLVRGKVEDTIPDHAPASIAVLRLDTDWYESTIHELEHLYPRLSSNGVLVVDDYGVLEGARDATDEYFAEHGSVLLHRINFAVRQAIKP
ncbi:MAG: class I SAM-dependent methyltransferase [Acidimicrobiales bacterium]|nr:class I SAM-dependent methyltransferase [Acidimicrobiales bacterium]